MSPHYSPIISALVTMLLTLFLSLNKQGMLQDSSAETVEHAGPLPRNGGISLMAGVLAGWAVLFKSWAWWLVLPAIGLFALSLLDEAGSLSRKARLAGQLVAAVCVAFGAGVPVLWWLPVLAGIVWMANLYGEMDGSDGMGGGMALFGFTFYGAAGLMHGNEAFAMMCFSIGAAGLGFLYHNFHPAKALLGNSGTVPLGFLAAGFGVWGWQQGYWPFWFPVLIFSPFFADATVTALKRQRNRQGAAESHYYQRLKLMGWDSSRIATTEYVLMALAGISALVGIGMDGSGQGNLLAYWAAIYLALSMWVDKRWRLHRHRETDNGANL